MSERSDGEKSPTGQNRKSVIDSGNRWWTCSVMLSNWVRPVLNLEQRWRRGWEFRGWTKKRMCMPEREGRVNMKDKMRWKIRQRRTLKKNVHPSQKDPYIAFDYIPLLGLSISIEFALSDSSKTVHREPITSYLSSCDCALITNFYFWLFSVLNAIFHFSVFTYSIKTLRKI